MSTDQPVAPLCVLDPDQHAAGKPGTAVIFLSREGAASLRKALDRFEDENAVVPVVFPVLEGQDWNWVMLRPTTHADLDRPDGPCSCGCQRGFPPESLEPQVQPSVALFKAFDPDDQFAQLQRKLEQRELLEWPGGRAEVLRFPAEWCVRLHFTLPLPAASDQSVTVNLPLQPNRKWVSDRNTSHTAGISDWSRDRQHALDVMAADGYKFDMRTTYTDPRISKADKRVLLDAMQERITAFNTWAQQVGLAKALIMQVAAKRHASVLQFRQGCRAALANLQQQLDTCRAVLQADDPEAVYADNVKLITANPARVLLHGSDQSE